MSLTGKCSPFSFNLCVYVAHNFHNSILLMPRERLTDEQKLQVSMACAGAQALCSLSESKPNKESMRKFGLVPLMSRLLKSVHMDLIVPIMGTCQNCASEVIALYFSFAFCHCGSVQKKSI